MANVLKGITIEIGGDTSRLDKALQSVNDRSRDLSSELGEINRLLKMDPGNADLLAQKQQVLADAVTNTKEKLDKLKEAEKQVQAQFERGEASAEQVRALQREIEATEQKLGQYEKAVKETADAVDNLGKVNQETADAMGKLGDAGLKSVGALVGAAATALTAAAETTRDYRMEMGKLDTAFQDSGFSSEAATAAYTDLVGVLGEYDQSVEAANHLAKLTDNEKDLATWTGDILPGLFATFGDSLPIEGLTEAANETAKVGEVTGPLADALNWAGIAEEEFNESLAKCTTEQERQTLIMETLAGVYGNASAAYKETNADVIAANQANDAWTQSMAQVGAAAEPLITEVKLMGAALLSDLVPVIQTLLDNLPMVAVVIAGLTAAFISFKIAALGGMAAAIAPLIASFKTLFAVMLANPIGLIIVAVTALVAGFMYLWKNCEGFREFWINLWQRIKTAAINAADGLKQLPEKIKNAISGAIQRVQEWGTNLVARAKTAATNMLNNVVNTLKNLPSRAYNAIVGAIQRVQDWGRNLANKAKTAASNMLDNVVTTLRNIPSRVTSAISGAIQSVASWGSDMASKAKSGMANVVSTVVSALSGLPGKVLSIGGDLVTGLWSGINNKLSWLIGKIQGFASSALGAIKKFFGVNSPSKETAWIGEMLDEGLAEGMMDNIDSPVAAMQRVTGGVLDAAQNVNGLTLGRQLQANYSPPAAATGANSGILDKLDRILSAIEQGQVLTIDGDQLVGATASKIDRRLGQQRALAARGAV